MSTETTVEISHRDADTGARPGKLDWFRNRHGLVRFGSVALLAIVTCLLLAPWLMPFPPNQMALVNKLQPPDQTHLLGTDQFGRDVLSRVLDGGLFSTSIAGITLVLCALIGCIVGAYSAMKGGWVDEFIMRFSDILIAFPDVVIAMFLISILGKGYGTLIIALTIVGWTPFARMMRGLTFGILSRDYILAAKSLGCSQSFIILRHIIPNTIGPIIAMGFLRYGHKLITVGALSFIGLGIQPPNSDWGAMLSDGRNYMDVSPWLVLAPGVAIFVTALSVTMIGRGLELERNDPARPS